MNRTELLKRSLQAVTCQKTEARNHLRQAESLQIELVIQYWTAQLEEHQATYQGLLNWLLEESGGQP